MNVYFAAPYSWRESLLPKRDQLVDAGINVVSSWLDSEPQDPPKVWARIDIHEVQLCDILVAFTSPDRKHWQSGGRHVEMGYAMALGKIVMRIGPAENIFHELVSYSCNSWEIGAEVLQLWAKHPEMRAEPWKP